MGFKTIFCNCNLLLNKDSNEVTMGNEACGKLSLSCRDIFCCLIMSCATTVFVLVSAGKGAQRWSSTMAIPFPMKFIQTTNVMTPLLFHTFSMFNIVSSHSVDTEHIRKCPFVLRVEVCVLVGTAGQKASVQSLQKQFFRMCLWVLSYFNFPLPFPKVN